MISPTLWHLYDLYINHIVIYQEVLSIDIRGVAGLGRRSWPEAEGTLLQPFGRSLAAGFPHQTLGISPTKMGISPTMLPEGIIH